MAGPIAHRAAPCEEFFLLGQSPPLPYGSWRLRELRCAVVLMCRRARADPRGMVSYNDLDAPPDVD